ncbi:uncharacterized protein VP01_5054g1, partial [Puccinia sorghi]
NGKLWCAPGWIDIDKLKSADLPGLKSNTHVKYPLVFLANSSSRTIFTCCNEFTHKPPLFSSISTNNMTLKPLYQLHDMIIEIFITYFHHTRVGGRQFLQKTQLQKYFLCHKYTLFCLYLVAGVHGALAFGFLSAVEHIFKKKKQPQCEGLEPIWKSLGAYIDCLFIDSFLTPNCLLNFCHSWPKLSLPTSLFALKHNFRPKNSNFLVLLLQNEYSLLLQILLFALCMVNFEAYHFYLAKAQNVGLADWLFLFVRACQCAHIASSFGVKNHLGR